MVTNPYPGSGNNTPQWKLDHIIKYASSRSASRLARETNMSVTFVYDYCEVNKLQLQKRQYGEDETFFKKIRRLKITEPEPIKRPPAVYDNKSHEQRLEELLGNNY